jgi:hypothetical protein
LTICEGKEYSRVRIDVVVASGSVAARVGGAFVDVLLAQVAAEPVDAEALEVGHAVQAGAAVEAGRGGAVVHVDEAVAALEALPAAALVRAVSVDAGTDFTD